MKLNDLVPNEKSKKERKRLGRGIASGSGKTSGRGTKGQRSRSGEGGKLYRQGGNLPFFRRLPFKRGEGFTPPNQVEYNEINLAVGALRRQQRSRGNPRRAKMLQEWKPVVIMAVVSFRSR